MLNNRTLMIAGAAVGVAVLVWLSTRSAKGIGEAIGGAAVDLVGGVAGGVVGGTVKLAGSIGSSVGRPDPDQQKAAQAKKEGDVWGAVVYMPMPDFIKWIAAGMPKE